MGTMAKKKTKKTKKGGKRGVGGWGGCGGGGAKPPCVRPEEERGVGCEEGRSLCGPRKGGEGKREPGQQWGWGVGRQGGR